MIKQLMGDMKRTISSSKYSEIKNEKIYIMLLDILSYMASEDEIIG